LFVPGMIWSEASVQQFFGSLKSNVIDDSRVSPRDNAMAAAIGKDAGSSYPAGT